MDRADLSDAIIQERGALFEEELRAAGPALLRVDLDGMEARVQAVSRRGCWPCGRSRGGNGRPARPVGGCCGW